MESEFVCELCGETGHLFGVGDHPEFIKCVGCGRSADFDEMYAGVKNLIKAVNREMLRDLLRTSRRIEHRRSQSLHGFRIDVKL